MSLLSQPRAIRRRLYVVLDVPGVSPAQSSRWESRLNVLLRECGCAFGALSSGIALIAAIAFAVFHSPVGFSSWSSLLLRTLILIMVTGGVGKLAGLGLAELEIRHISSQLTRIIASRPDGGNDRCRHAQNGWMMAP